MALVGLLMALLVVALLFGRFTGGSPSQPTGKTGGPAAAPLLAEPEPALNPGATLRSVQQAGAASAAREQQRQDALNKALQ